VIMGELEIAKAMIEDVRKAVAVPVPNQVVATGGTPPAPALTE
jgi:hypothetical protein